VKEHFKMKRLVIIVLLLVMFTIQSLTSITTNSATFDEVQNFGIGKYLLLNQKWDVMGAIVQPPLSYYLTSIPLLLTHDDPHLWEYEEKDRDIFFLGAVDFYRGQGLLSAPANANDRQLILSRLTVLALSLLLAVYLFRFTMDLYGETAGYLALGVFAFCPNMLAFSGISTQDMPMAALSFIACYHYWYFLRCQSLSRSLTAGLFLGLALATKLTAILLIPFELLAYTIYQIKEKKKPTSHPAVILGLGGIVLFASYGFNLTPFFQGIELTRTMMNIGQGVFFHGSLANHGWWYFYPAAYLLKTPLPIVILLGAALFCAAGKFKNSWFDTTFIALPIVALFVVFSSSNFAIGVRYLLPVYPFMYVMIGGLALEGARVRLLTYLMAAWLVAGTFFVAPHYLAYFNELIGGPANGYKYLVDSNLDWGQGLKELKRYMDVHGVKRVSLSYFGADSPQRYGIEYDWLPSYHLYNPEPDKPYKIPQNQLLAISATNLQGVYLQNPEEFKWLRELEPVAKIGYSIFVYDLNSRTPVK
jgi:4-amino-4-deoxy-L-arabinose transferase-like glycosyltransferase